MGSFGSSSAPNLNGQTLEKTLELPTGLRTVLHDFMMSITLPLRPYVITEPIRAPTYSEPRNLKGGMGQPVPNMAHAGKKDKIRHVH